MKCSFSQAETWKSCPYKWKLRYQDRLDVIPDDKPDNALYLGSALHKGIETDVDTAVHLYYSFYPVTDERHETEVLKLKYWIPKVKELIPDNVLHEYHIECDQFIGFLDLLVPATRLDMNLPTGLFDLYDFKYSNNIDHYMQSAQLSVYKYWLEHITKKKIRKLSFMFIPKVQLKRMKDEPWEMYWNRLEAELEKNEIQIREVNYQESQVLDWIQTVHEIETSTQYPENTSYLCRWCDYADYCQKGKDYMILPKNERRTVGQISRRKIWIYGPAFSGKTTFVDAAPSPLNLNTDGNIQFVTMPYLPIKDTYEGRRKILAWDTFKTAIDELEKKDNDYQTIVVDLLEDVYQSCRVYMYDKLGITHESDDAFRAWDEVRTEFLSQMRRLMNLDYQNIVLISHEDTSRDITRRSGDKVTAVKPNIQDKIANKIAGMVDLVARVVVDGDERSLVFPTEETVFGGGRLKGITETSIPLQWSELVRVYDEANKASRTGTTGPQTAEKHKDDEVSTKEEQPVEQAETKPQMTLEEANKAIEEGDFQKVAQAEVLTPPTTASEPAAPQRRTRRRRKEEN